jgi:hypothetical protein
MMNLVNWSDHDLARVIKDHNLKLVVDKENNTNYYHSENYVLEILVIFDNEKNTRKIIYSYEILRMQNSKA